MLPVGFSIVLDSTVEVSLVGVATNSLLKIDSSIAVLSSALVESETSAVFEDSSSKLVLCIVKVSSLLVLDSSSNVLISTSVLEASLVIDTSIKELNSSEETLTSVVAL